MPRYMGNVVYQNFTKWLPIDAFIINEYFTFGHDIDYIESLISLSTNLTYDIYRSLTTRASITIKDNYTLSNYEKKILPHTQ